MAKISGFIELKANITASELGRYIGRVVRIVNNDGNEYFAVLSKISAHNNRITRLSASPDCEWWYECRVTHVKRRSRRKHDCCVSKNMHDIQLHKNKIEPQKTTAHGGMVEF